MFPSAANLSSSCEVNKAKLSNSDWLHNQSYQVPVETLDDGDESGRIKNRQSKIEDSVVDSDVLETSDNDIELIKEIQVIKDKSKKKKKKKKKDSSSPTRHSRDRDESSSRHHRDSKDKIKNLKDKERRKKVEWSPEELSSVKGQKIENFGNKVFIEEVGLPPEKAFHEDLRPDRNNLAFESVYNLLVPSYNKKNCSKSKGLLDTIRKLKQAPTRYFDAKLLDESNEIISVVEKRDLLNLPEYLPIQPAFKVISRDSRNLGDSLKDVHDRATALYIKAQDSNKIGNADIEEKSTLSSDEKHMQNRTKEFNEYLRSYPNDIDKWFKFLQFQEDSFIWSASEKCTTLRENVLAEKKLSIVNKALEANPKCMRLLLERLNLMGFISSPNELDKEWKKLTFVYPNNPTVWKKYFIFLQTHISHFSVTKLSRAFFKCFEICNSMLEGTFQTHQVIPNLETEIVIIIFHYTTFISQAGYPEKAIAIWQILIEFNLFTPDFLTHDQPLSEWKALLEPFWDSGCSRFGEIGAIGWSNVMKTKSLNQGPSKKPIDDLEDPLLEKYANNRPKLWVEIEKLREKHYWFPVKGPDADQADDIERNVSLEDLTKILFRFREDETKYKLVLFFLKFLRAIEVSDILDSVFLVDDSSIISPIPSLFNLSTYPFDHDYPSFQDQVFIQAINQFKGTNYEKEIIIWRLKFLIGQVGVSLKYKDVKKTIKDYLKLENNRNDLDMWQLLTALEVKKGGRKEACTIYETAIDLFIGRINSRYLFELIRSYCELLFDIEDLTSPDLSFVGPRLKETENQALRMILSVVVGKKTESFGSPLVLKASKTFETMVQVIDDFTPNILFCHLLMYLIVKDSTLAFNECETLLESEDEVKLKKLDIFTIYLQLLIIDARRTLKPISKLRNVCKRALEQFPTHKLFLSLFVNIESNVAIPISVDRFFTQLIRNTESSNLVIWIFKLHFELKRLNIIKGSSEGNQACDGIIRRINGLFERCLSFPCNQGIIVLWRTFMKFNIDHGNPKKAESIVYRAIQNCPWSKMLYIDAIDTFPHLLNELITIMSEKEIRLRAPLEEIELLLESRDVQLNDSNQPQLLEQVT